MPRLGDNLESHDLGGSHYGYSGERMKRLEEGASAYTIVNLLIDVSPSTGGFTSEMEQAVIEIFLTLQDAPRADNLLLRVGTFAADLVELHGFKLLETCNRDDYNGCLHIHGGRTALFDATDNAIQSMGDYGDQLDSRDIEVNGITFIITDGDDNASKMSTSASVKASLQKIVQEEKLESVITVLIGVNTRDTQVKKYLEDFQKEAGLTQFVAIDDANANTLAKLADFVSKSISAQSQSLGSGGPSVPISLTL